MNGQISLWVVWKRSTGRTRDAKSFTTCILGIDFPLASSKPCFTIHVISSTTYFMSPSWFSFHDWQCTTGPSEGSSPLIRYVLLVVLVSVSPSPSLSSSQIVPTLFPTYPLVVRFSNLLLRSRPTLLGLMVRLLVLKVAPVVFRESFYRVRRNPLPIETSPSWSSHSANVFRPLLTFSFSGKGFLWRVWVLGTFRPRICRKREEERVEPFQ